MVAVHILNLLSGYSLNAYGLRPRSVQGLFGIVASPFLHGSTTHLISNAVPFAVLSGLVLLGGVGRYVKASLLVIIIGGVLVWAFGRDANHVGASGWVLGLWSFLLGQAWYGRNWKNLALGLLVLLLYGGMVFSFVPRYGVSFESHIFGAIAGWLAALLLSRAHTASA